MNLYHSFRIYAILLETNRAVCRLVYTNLLKEDTNETRNCRPAKYR